MPPGSNTGGQRDGNGTTSGHPGNRGNSPGQTPFSSAAYYSGGSGGGASGSDNTPEPRPAARISLQRSSSSGKLGTPRATRLYKGGGKGGRQGLAAVAALLNRKRITMICIAAVIGTYFSFSSHWLTSSPPPAGVGFKRQDVKLLPPRSAPANQPSGDLRPPQQVCDVHVIVRSGRAPPYAPSPKAPSPI